MAVQSPYRGGLAVQAAPAGQYAHYQRRRPEVTILFRLVQEVVETFLVESESNNGMGLPDFVKDE